MRHGPSCAFSLRIRPRILVAAHGGLCLSSMAAAQSIILFQIQKAHPGSLLFRGTSAAKLVTLDRDRSRNVLKVAAYYKCKRRTSSTNNHEAALRTYRVSTTILFIRAQPSSTIVEAGTDLLHVPISRALMMLQAYSVSLYSPICLRHFINIHRDILES